MNHPDKVENIAPRSSTRRCYALWKFVKISIVFVTSANRVPLETMAKGHRKPPYIDSWLKVLDQDGLQQVRSLGSKHGSATSRRCTICVAMTVKVSLDGVYSC